MNQYQCSTANSDNFSDQAITPLISIETTENYDNLNQNTNLVKKRKPSYQLFRKKYLQDKKIQY